MTEAKMQESVEYKPGTFCWVELGTTDGEAAKKFYTQLFDWEFDDHDMGPGGVYTILKQNGKDVGALYTMPEEMTANGVPPHWMSYISVANADEATAKAKSLGANVMKEPFDVFTMGRMAVIQDPTGAMFALWQPGTHSGAGVVNTPNSLCWNELATKDAARAGEFYSGVFGWEKNVQQMGPMTYTSFMNGDRPAGGMYEPGPEMGEVPPHWMIYFAVADTDATLARATELGGKSCVPPMDVPGVGRMAIMTDPQGAAFAFIKLLNAPA
ncbi:MAG TPA: VOC family protein [Pyrinomonadaceae bacterium]|jgi:predicted enzyme related to lactoylglutathione lyase|nr:VOC family protein [Pyrinomonadaceae bacterium]